MRQGLVDLPTPRFNTSFLTLGLAWRVLCPGGTGRKAGETNHGFFWGEHKGESNPNGPRMEYLSTNYHKFKPNVGKYGIHAAFGKQNGSEFASPKIEQSNQNFAKKKQQQLIIVAILPLGVIQEPSSNHTLGFDTDPNQRGILTYACVFHEVVHDCPIGYPTHQETTQKSRLMKTHWFPLISPRHLKTSWFGHQHRMTGCLGKAGCYTKSWNHQGWWASPLFIGFHTSQVVGLGISEPSTVRLATKTRAGSHLHGDIRPTSLRFRYHLPWPMTPWGVWRKPHKSRYEKTKVCVNIVNLTCVCYM